jgi:hypothetical protein
MYNCRRLGGDDQEGSHGKGGREPLSYPHCDQPDQADCLTPLGKPYSGRGIKRLTIVLAPAAVQPTLRNAEGGGGA